MVCESKNRNRPQFSEFKPTNFPEYLAESLEGNNESLHTTISEVLLESQAELLKENPGSDKTEILRIIGNG